MYQPNKPYFNTKPATGLEIRNEGSQREVQLPKEAALGAYFRFESGAVSGFSVKQKNGVLVLIRNK